MHRAYRTCLTAVVVAALISCSIVVTCHHDSDATNRFYVDDDDYESFASENCDRSRTSSYDDICQMFMDKAIVDDDRDGDGISTLDNCLEYVRTTYSSAGSIQDAVLEYVHREFVYVSDQDLYGAVDWAAYPVETIVNGGGDCEDLTILVTSLLHRAGCSCGILLFSDHAVSLAPTGVVTAEEEGDRSFISVTEGGQTYVCLETTSDLPAGYAYGGYSRSSVVTFTTAIC